MSFEKFKSVVLHAMKSSGYNASIRFSKDDKGKFIARVSDGWFFTGNAVNPTIYGYNRNHGYLRARVY